MNVSECKVFLRTDTAKFSYPAHKGDVGYDLYADEDVILRQRNVHNESVHLTKMKRDETNRVAVKTGVSIQFKSNIGTNTGYARIAPRSGLSLSGIDIYGGVVDSSYTGELMVIMENNSVYSEVYVHKGDKIAQLIFEQANFPSLRYVSQLEETTRGSGGFGSTDSPTNTTMSSNGTLNSGYNICTQNV